MIRVNCPDCNKKYGISENHLGKKFACKECGNHFVLKSPKTAQKKNRSPKNSLPPKRKKERSPVTRLPRNRQADENSGSRNTKTVSKQLKDIIGKLRLLDDFPKPRPTLRHRITALFVACTMLVLPLLYIAFVCGVGWLTWWHITQNYTWLSYLRGRSVIYGAILYGFLGFAGVVWFFSLLKPLFMRIESETSEDSLDRNQNPALFNFTDAIAEIVGSPKPDKINFVYDVNAYASYETKFFGLFRKNFSLTLGIPLIAGFNVDELAGVVAHEFGHFSQSGSTLLHRFIQKVNSWFALAVFSHSSVDALIESTSDDDDGYSILGFLLWILVGMGKIILWILMNCGLLVSSTLLRQMEFDADKYETGLIGSEGFKKSSKKLIALSISNQIAAEYTLRSSHGHSLPDNLPEFAAGIANRSEMINKKTIKVIRTEKHGYFNSHPTTLARIDAAKKRDLPGTFHCKLPASKLIKNWPKLSKAWTIIIYNMHFGPDFSPSTMKPVKKAINDYLEAMK